METYRERGMLLRHRVNLVWPRHINDRPRVEDDGTIVGIYEDEVRGSLTVLEAMCNSIGATIQSVEQRRVSRRPELFAAEAHVVLNRPTTLIRRSSVSWSSSGVNTNGLQ